MSDLILGAIIGGAIGVIASILGFVVQGYYSNKSTKMQIEARQEEQSRQFKYEKEQQEIARLIQVREEWIKPLDSLLQEFSAGSLKVEGERATLYVNFPNGQTGKPSESSGLEYDRLRLDLEDAVTELGALAERLEVGIARISDEQLKDMASRLMRLQILLSIKSFGNIDEAQHKSLREHLDEISKITASAYKRIEELLCGR